MAEGVDFLALRASQLAPTLGTQQQWLRQAYEVATSQLPKGADPEPKMAEFLHDRCSVLDARARGMKSLQDRVNWFRSVALVPPEVQAANRRRLQEAGGLTDELKHELGQETEADKHEKRVQLAREKSRSAQDRSNEHE